MYPMRERSAPLPASRPSTRSDPDRITWTPTIDLINVDLPLPLGPRSPVTTPARTAADRSSSAGRPPRTTCNRSLTRPNSEDPSRFLAHESPDGPGLWDLGEGRPTGRTARRR